MVAELVLAVVAADLVVAELVVAVVAVIAVRWWRTYGITQLWT